jgi:hypothetical protein
MLKTQVRMRGVRFCAAVLVASGLALATAACRHLSAPTGPAEPPQAASPTNASAARAYAGLKLRDDTASGQTLVSWVFPGPLAGTGFASPYVNRGDSLRSVNGKPASVAAFAKLIESAKPG